MNIALCKYEVEDIKDFWGLWLSTFNLPPLLSYHFDRLCVSALLLIDEGEKLRAENAALKEENARLESHNEELKEGYGEMFCQLENCYDSMPMDMDVEDQPLGPEIQKLTNRMKKAEAELAEARAEIVTLNKVLRFYSVDLNECKSKLKIGDKN